LLVPAAAAICEGMPPVTTPRPKKGLLSKLVPSGEGMVAHIGLGLAGVILAAVVASGWWMTTSQRSATLQARREEADLFATLLSQHSATLIARSELSDLRVLVAESAHRHGFDVTVSLPDGRVVASSNTAEIRAGALPEKWTEGQPVEPFTPSESSRRVDAYTTALVPKRGAIVVHVGSTVALPAWSSSEVSTGIACIGIGALGFAWVAYRALRRRVRVMSLVRDALYLAQDGVEAAPSTLGINSSFGPEAEAWNKLLADAEATRNKTGAERAADQLSTRRGREGGALHTAFDAMSDGLILVDDRAVVTFANGAAAVLLGIKRDELNGSDLTKHLADTELTKVIREISAGENRSRRTIEVKTKASGQGETDALARIGPAGVNGYTTLRFNVRPVRKEDNAAAMIVIEDVTQQRVADESRNAFVAAATHELRTPLTNIRLYVDSLLEPGEIDAVERGKALNVISGETKRLERLIQDMLSVSEIEAGSMKLRRSDVRLDDLLEEIRADFDAQAKSKEIKLEYALPPKLPVLQGDRDKITLALHNLIGNALKYTPAGGQVGVRVETSAAQLLVEVTDNGIGIKPEETELIFEKFYRARDKRLSVITGTGLGLPIARQVARLHGGDITCRSQIDKGSVFTLTLPLGAAA
jgi:signal transduction histidine kinase